MIEDMTVRNFVEKTRHDYIRHVRTFTAFLGRQPSSAVRRTRPCLRIFAVSSSIRRRPACADTREEREGPAAGVTAPCPVQRWRSHGAAWRQANAGHVSLDQLKVMSAIERCRTAALGPAHKQKLHYFSDR
jgi:hypothetical protein